MPRCRSSYVYALAVNAALGCCFWGYCQSIMNSLQEYLHKNIYDDFSDSLIYLMTSLIPAGAALGAISAGKIAMKIGRRRALILTDIVSLVSVALTLIENPYSLLFGRFLTGICVGFNSSLVPLYVSEMSPAEARGITGTFTQVSVSVGILIAYLAGLNLPTQLEKGEKTWWWRLMLGFPALFAVTRIFLLFWIFKTETPRYLLTRADESEVLEALEKIYGEEHSQEQRFLLQQERSAKDHSKEITYSDLFSAKYRTRLKVGCFVTLFQQFTGVNGIIFYSTKLFEMNKSGVDDKSPEIYTVIVGVLNLLSALISTCLIKRKGRRELLLYGTGILVISWVALAIVGWTASLDLGLEKYFIFLFILGFGFSSGAITWIYVSEILPDIGVGIAVFLTWIGCVVVAQGFPSMIDSIGASPTFVIFASFCSIGFILINRWVQETKDKTPAEITQMFTSEKNLEGDDEEEIKEGLLGREEKMSY